MEWYQIFVKVPDGNGYSDPKMTKRIDEHITSNFPAAFVAPNGIPIKNENGEYEVRCFVPFCLEAVQNILTKNYGLIISRVVNNS